VEPAGYQAAASVEETTMSDGVYVDLARVEVEGAKRQNAHAHNSTERLFADPYQENNLGVAAELAFAEWSGLQPDLAARPNGDGLKDFQFCIAGQTLTIDVKAARMPIYLLLKQSKARKASDILVLAGVDIEAGRVWFMGWEHKRVMLISPLKTFGLHVCHYRPNKELRPMRQLRNLLAGRYDFR
jgi:hypothetical protein